MIRRATRRMRYLADNVRDLIVGEVLTALVTLMVIITRPDIRGRS